MKQPIALIFGITGQDGAYLAKLLVDKGYQVFGTTRSAVMANLSNLSSLGLIGSVTLVELDLNDINSITGLLDQVRPSEVYNLSGMSSVAMSFLYPEEAHKSISVATFNILECIRRFDRNIRFFNACSGECFGNTESCGADENSPFQPRSPYSIAKVATYWNVANYRNLYGLYACSGILFNHESPLRAETFVTKKIILGALAIAKGELPYLELGNIDTVRDWGWAPDYVEAMWRMLQLNSPTDFVIASGKPTSLKNFLEHVFSQLSLDWEKHVRINNQFIRPFDITFSLGNPSKALSIMDWKTSISIDEIVSLMLNDVRKDHAKVFN